MYMTTAASMAVDTTTMTAANATTAAVATTAMTDGTLAAVATATSTAAAAVAAAADAATTAPFTTAADTRTAPDVTAGTTPRAKAKGTEGGAAVAVHAGNSSTRGSDAVAASDDLCGSILCSTQCQEECGWSRSQGLCVAGMTTGAAEMQDRLGDCPAEDDSPAATIIAGVVVAVLACIVITMACVVYYCRRAPAEQRASEENVEPNNHANTPAVVETEFGGEQVSYDEINDVPAASEAVYDEVDVDGVPAAKAQPAYAEVDAPAVPRSAADDGEETYDMPDESNMARLATGASPHYDKIEVPQQPAANPYSVLELGADHYADQAGGELEI